MAAAYVRYLRRRFGIETDAALVQPIGDLVQGTFASVLAFSEPDDGVILHVPNYPPFREAITVTNRRLLPLTMHDTGKRHEFDPDEMRRLVDARTRKIVLCNPEIIKKEGKQSGGEGCLSIPEFRESVSRARKVTIRAQDIHGKWFEKTGEDLLARAFLHETDHLNGKLYISHISAIKRDFMKRKIRKLMKAGEW